jgi:hypothetical protein
MLIKHKFLINLFFVFALLFTIIACKKEKNDVLKWNLSFDYNGKRYDLGRPETDANGAPLWPNGGATGAFTEWDFGEDYIWINRPDILGGIIKFKGPDCSFFYPAPLTRDNIYTSYDSCKPFINNTSIDSNAVYFYKAGFAKGRSENCITKRIRDITTGNYFTQIDCDYYGTFEVELVNKEGKSIKISNGSYIKLQ